ncbi:uncharacterized protein LOC111909660 [Lactuca sativa]|uniref:uncharacterized protein LOC111909660 n=1 Tax=Lactuca sativa TaxID=4236 RepID=UPI000CD83AB6|nr:uncharacterized protein LOC111909660 [Lactuca sativa]
MYGSHAGRGIWDINRCDEYMRMSETVTRDAVIKFVEGVIACFGEKYLRRPNEVDLARLLHVWEERGFPGMIGIIDCMHWTWKNCPTAWAGQYAGTCNDINVLHRYPIFNDVLAGRAPNVSYVVNDWENNMAYYITDGIYPSWAAFVKSITSPQLRKHKLFAEHQVAARKDVKRAFGVLQARFAFLRHPCLLWDKDMMRKIMIACIIIHNMIVEDERCIYLHYYDPSEFLNDRPTNHKRRTYIEDDDQNLEYSTQRIADLSSYMTNRAQLRNREAHNILKNNLIEHI